MSTWELDDAQEIAAEAPYTFYKPSPEVIGMLRPGDQVKLIFRFAHDPAQQYDAERMWVTIVSIEGERFSGTLDSEPMHGELLAWGAPVEFGPRHIIQTSIPDPAPSLTAAYTDRCFVTARILDDGVPVGYLYREAPERDDESGWCISAGDETDEYMVDDSKISYVSLGAVLNRDDSFIGLLKAPVGSVFVRNKVSGAFEPVDDDQV